jgi:hypothetical protein
METENTKNQNMYYLWWVNQNTQKKFCAGRAFYREEYGDYALYINLLETSSTEGRRDEFYLKPTETMDELIRFNIIKVFRRNEKSYRFCIGDGFLGKKTAGDIHLHIEPLTSYGKRLVLSLNQTEGKKND